MVGLLMIPLLIGGLRWAKTEMEKTESAFQTFKKARMQMIETSQPVELNGITIKPLEDLDQNKKSLSPIDLMNLVSLPSGPL